MVIVDGAEVVEPRTLAEIDHNVHATWWLKALEVEFAALEANGTWVVVPRPDGIKIIRSRCMLKVKAKADGSLNQFKARVIARGDQQEMGGMGETFAPVANMLSVRIFWQSVHC
jgi:hypothetical protein